MDKILWAEGEARSYHIVWIFKHVQKKNRCIEKQRVQYNRKIVGTYRGIQDNIDIGRYWRV